MGRQLFVVQWTCAVHQWRRQDVQYVAGGCAPERGAPAARGRQQYVCLSIGGDAGAGFGGYYDEHGVESSVFSRIFSNLGILRDGGGRAPADAVVLWDELAAAHV